MFNASILKRANIIAGSVALLLATSAYAKDTVYLDEITGLTINDITVDDFKSRLADKEKLTFATPFVVNSKVKLTLKWKVDTGNGAPTLYDNKHNVITFSAMSPANNALNIQLSTTTCTFADPDTVAESSCEFDISFNLPNEANQAQIHIKTSSPDSNEVNKNNVLQAEDTHINFTVEEENIVKLGTTLKVKDSQCFAYQAGEVNLTSNLFETSSKKVISDATVNYMIDGEPVDSAMTDGSGEANLPYNVNNLKVGDHNLFAAYKGNSHYTSSDDSAMMGIYYNFSGFLPPINPEGNSIFGNGRVIPVKIKLFDANQNPVSDAQPTVWIYKAYEGNELGEVIEAASSVSSADSGNIMRYDPVEQQYIYNADLSALTNGTYAIVVETGDSDCFQDKPKVAFITVEKKGKK
ncbi:PxKF domain-containing protein [Shewanella acanthi]|uniref:PxKF domain-containing protein n=1 Tax=Shewanella acanthi TaxID=2864212 RepID=UPI001C6602CB|nr:PxKF domain-containing protein [Shewanella acanthi]QYJ78396.1 Ig-like domain-containing protein [Shewanella acanthi]